MRKVLEHVPVVWGGMLVNQLAVPANTDLTPLLEGLPNDMCQCPHWGYIFKGALYIRYTDGSEELYDHQADPNEWTNLAADPANADTIARLRNWLPKKNAKPAHNMKPPKKP